MITDRIEKKIVLKAPRERVWRAICDFRQFGAWFGAELDGPFVAGEWLSGRIMPTQVDPEVAKLQEPHAGTPWRMLVEAIEPMERFAFRWHPFAIDKSKDYSDEPTTLVTFTLSDAEGGTLLTITESGFDKLPPERRDQAFKANEGGWEHQCRLVEKYLARGAGG
jgi:uncharacterized protein YndB with AHSA1/START domain